MQPQRLIILRRSIVGPAPIEDAGLVKACQLLDPAPLPLTEPHLFERAGAGVTASSRGSEGDAQVKGRAAGNVQIIVLAGAFEQCDQTGASIGSLRGCDGRSG